MMPVNEKAPIVESGQVWIGAGLPTVWGVLTAIERWPEWYPSVHDVSLEGPLLDGTVFRWMHGRAAIRSMLLEVEPPRFIAWRGTLPGISAVHVWRLDRAVGGTMVTTEESWQGLLPLVLRRRCRRALRQATASALQGLRQQAESVHSLGGTGRPSA
jgi:hypothetical protein